MFRRARVRLTLLYIGLFALVLGIFSGVFYRCLTRRHVVAILENQSSMIDERATWLSLVRDSSSTV